MSKLPFEEHVLDAEWNGIYSTCNKTIEDSLFFRTNKSSQHVQKIKFMRSLFRGDLNVTLGVDFSKASSQGAEREARLRGWSEELWALINDNSQGMIYDRNTKQTYDVLEEVCEHHGGDKSNWCTRFGFFNTFRAPGPAKQGRVVQDDEHGNPFLKMQSKWMRQEALLREAEHTARRIIEEERKHSEANAIAATKTTEVVTPILFSVVGQPVPSVQKYDDNVQTTTNPKGIQDIDEDDDSDYDNDYYENKHDAEVACSYSATTTTKDKKEDEKATPHPPSTLTPPALPPSPPRGPSPTLQPPVVPPLMNLPQSVPEHASQTANYGKDTINEVKSLWTKAQALGKKRMLDYDSNGICEPFKYRGWIIRTHKRGLTKKGTFPVTICDSYWVSPCGKKFRSAKELDRAFPS